MWSDALAERFLSMAAVKLLFLPAMQLCRPRLGVKMMSLLGGASGMTGVLKGG
jgi:hypothetical protein